MSPDPHPRVFLVFAAVQALIGVLNGAVVLFANGDWFNHALWIASIPMAAHYVAQYRKQQRIERLYQRRYETREWQP